MGVLKKFVIRSASIRERVREFIAALPSACLWEVTITEYRDSKTKAQERHYHKQFDIIAPHFVFMGQKGLPAEDVKRLLIDAFARVKEEQGEPLEQRRKRGGPRLVPSIDGKGVVMLGDQSREFTLKEGSEFIEYLYAYGSDLGVRWSEVSFEE